ncbi:MAG: hypothetical protein WB816_09760 [Methylocystis sp.]
MNSTSLFATHPVKSWTVALSGGSGFLFAVFAGLLRWGGFDSNISGLILGVISGLFWYLAAVAPLHWPDRAHLAAALNSAAACAATGAVCYLIPDTTVALLFHHS